MTNLCRKIWWPRVPNFTGLCGSLLTSEFDTPKDPELETLRWDPNSVTVQTNPY